MTVEKEIIEEGLRSLDLKNFIYPFFEVDTYRSKMGEDRDVCVISFHVKNRDPARDLMEFIEKGYNFVLDADVSAGENSKGEYHVFVEFDRTPKLSEQIVDLLYGVKKLTGIDNWQFKYHKKHEHFEVTETSLNKIIPNTPSLYEQYQVSLKVEGLKKFFTKTLMDDLTLENNTITIHKPFNQQIKLKLIQEDDKEKILENTTDAVSLDEKAVSEIFWLTKVLGDYNINKIGENFVFENGNKAILIQRIE
jgi:hypothetical protein